MKLRIHETGDEAIVRSDAVGSQPVSLLHKLDMPGPFRMLVAGYDCPEGWTLVVRIRLCGEEGRQRRILKAGSLTTLNVPKLQYPGGYGVKVRGAVASDANARVLRLKLCGGAKEGHRRHQARAQVG